MTALPATITEPFAEKKLPSPVQPSAEHDTLPMPVASDNESQQILKDILQTLKSSTIAQEIGTDSRSSFWATYKREAKEFDDDFLDRYKEDMDIVLIFAGLFSAVSTTFITSMQSSLSQDPTATTNVLLMQLIHATNTSAFADQNFDSSSWDGPGSTVIWTQSLIYASLAASLLAALGAVLGKQWLSHYRQRISGTIEERALHRHSKYHALERWHFQAILEILPVLLQISLLLFGVALSAYVWTQQSTVGAVVIGATGFGIVFYVSITAASLFSHDCPFQTPLSSILQFISASIFRLAFFLNKRYVRRFKRYVEGLRKVDIAINVAYIVFFPIALTLIVIVWFIDLMNDLRVRSIIPPDAENPPVPPPGPLFKLDIPLDYELEAPAIRWLLETSTDQEVILTTARMVPDVEWPAEVDTSATAIQLRNSFEGCFVFEQGGPKDLKVAPFAHQRALVLGKALLHLYFSKLYLSEKFYNHPLYNRSTNRHLRACFTALKGDGEDDSSLFCSMMLWFTWELDENLPQISDSNRPWILRLLPHTLAHPECLSSVKNLALREIIAWFNPLLPHHILADCFLSAAILMGLPVDRKKISRTDKSSKLGIILRLFLQQLASAADITTTCSRSDKGHYARALIQPLALFLDGNVSPEVGTCESGQCLCGAVQWAIHTCVMYVTKSAGTNDPTLREDIWKNVRATLHLSAMLSTSCDHYKEGSSRQWLSTYHCGHDSLFNIDGPEWAVSFLKHHYDVHDDTAVADTFFMLSQSRNVKQWADSTLFMDALVFAMQGDQPVHVRHTALRTVWKMRHVLTQPNSVLLSSSQLSEFSSALYSAVSTNIHAPDDSNTDNSSDRFFSVERDMYYLQIIYTFSLNAQIVDIWNTCLRWHGHLERCRDLALYLGDTRMLTAQSAYLLAILEIVESHKIECNFVAAFNQELRRGHLICAWSLTAGLKPAALDLFPIEELLPTMIAFTSRYQDTYGLVKPTTLYKNPGRLLRNLRRNRPQSQAMIKLLKEKIPTWERR